jgi:hypothetical protein
MIKPEVRVVRTWCSYEKAIVYVVQKLRSNFLGIKSYQCVSVKSTEHRATEYAQEHYDYLLDQYTRWLESDKKPTVIWKKP